MVEADVLLRGGSGDPILAHPPDTDSDITLQEWLAEMVSTNKGIKLDFKSPGAVGPSLELLAGLRRALERPVWLNGDVLPGPRGGRPPLDARAFLAAVASSCPAATLSLGWTTGCHRGQGGLSLNPESIGLVIGILACVLKKNRAAENLKL